MPDPTYIALLSSRIAELSAEMRHLSGEVKTLTKAFEVMLEIQQGQGEMLRLILDRASQPPKKSELPATLQKLTEAVVGNSQAVTKLAERIAEVPAQVEKRVAIGVYAAMHDGELPPRA